MALANTQTIALANKKGGCGKTTTTVNLAAACAELGKRVCVIDIDGQCNMTTGFGLNVDQHLEEGKHTVLDVYLAKRRASDICVAVVGPDKEERFRWTSSNRSWPSPTSLSQKPIGWRTRCYDGEK